MTKFCWLLEVEVDELWVGDGFDFDKDRCRRVAENLLPYAYAGEVKVRVVKAPDSKEIRRAQGYEVDANG